MKLTNSNTFHLQSSCTRPESEPEEDGFEHIQSPTKPENAKCVSDGISTPGQEECHQQNNKKWAHERETEGNVLFDFLHFFTLMDERNAYSSMSLLLGLQAVAKSLADYAVREEEKNDDPMEEESRSSDIVPEIFLREAIDLIGNFDNHFKGSFGTSASISSASKFDLLPMLDLSLKRSHHSDERTGLNHSDASAFSR